MPFFVNGKNSVAVAFFTLFMAASAGSTLAGDDENQFGAWTMVCTDEADVPSDCWLTQVLQRQQDGHFLAEMRLRLVRSDSESQYLMTLRTPASILLTERAAYRVAEAGEPEAPMRWHNCTERRCTAVRSLELKEVESLRSAQNMVIGYQHFLETQPTVFEVSLMGVTAGLAALESRE